MLEECPHCYTGVMPSASGECPSCRENVKDLAGTDPNRTALTLSEAVPLPPHCCDCDSPTDRVVPVKAKIPGYGGGRMPTWVYLVLAPFLGLWAVLLSVLARANDGQRGRSGETFKVRMPQCELCGAAGPPRPIRIDRDRGLLTFVVHVGFKKRVTPG